MDLDVVVMIAVGRTQPGAVANVVVKAISDSPPGTLVTPMISVTVCSHPKGGFGGCVVVAVMVVVAIGDSQGSAVPASEVATGVPLLMPTTAVRVAVQPGAFVMVELGTTELELLEPGPDDDAPELVAESLPELEAEPPDDEGRVELEPFTGLPLDDGTPVLESSPLEESGAEEGLPLLELAPPPPEDSPLEVGPDEIGPDDDWPEEGLPVPEAEPLPLSPLDDPALGVAESEGLLGAGPDELDGATEDDWPDEGAAVLDGADEDWPDDGTPLLPPSPLLGSAVDESPDGTGVLDAAEEG